MNLLNLTPVPFQHITVLDGFWKDRQSTVANQTLRTCIDQCEKTGRIDNFRKAAGKKEGTYEGMYYNDSDVYKVLEGAAYLLRENADPALLEEIDAIVNDICDAQQEDGYLNSYFILSGLENRWTDMGLHEAYCLGHMIEAAVAYEQATGKSRWRKVGEKAVDQMMSEIGPGKKHWVTGHQELELALVRLYRHTGKKEYLDYALWLIDERGHEHLQSVHLNDHGFNPAYCQDDLPARELKRVTGHAVRAMYYYTAMADCASITGDEKLVEALDRLWNHVVPANLYVTGGIGQSRNNEGFTEDYHLPNMTAYCETCAAIGMALWNHRMALLDGDSKYADLVELEMYNGMLSGLSLKGDTFFYDNPLSSAGNTKRSPWFTCSCCPTNLVRFIPSIAGYQYMLGDNRVYINQYFSSLAELPLEETAPHIKMETGYPWDGGVAITVLKSQKAFTLTLRIPAWCKQWSLYKNGEEVAAPLEKGYISLQAEQGDEIRLNFNMVPRIIPGLERVKENAGRVAFGRGPVIYCAEQIDQQADMAAEYFPADLRVDENAPIEVQQAPEELGGIHRLRVDGLNLIPYYAWANREIGAMTVFVKKK